MNVNSSDTVYETIEEEPIKLLPMVLSPLISQTLRDIPIINEIDSQDYDIMPNDTSTAETDFPRVVW